MKGEKVTVRESLRGLAFLAFTTYGREVPDGKSPLPPGLLVAMRLSPTRTRVRARATSVLV